MVEPQRRGIQSVEIAMAVLEALEACGGAASLSKIAGLAGMPASKVHRYLVSLCRVGVVVQSAATGLYDLGPAARRLGAEAFRRTDEANIAGPHIADLRDRSGHSVNLAAWGEAGPVLIRWEIGRHPMSVTVRVGGSLPLWSSVGRVFLAFLPRDVTEPVLLAQRGGGVPEDVGYDTLADELATIRERRVCVVSNTPVLGIEGFAAPVFDAFGNVSLVIGVVTPHKSIGGDDRLQIIDLLLAASSTISAELGYSDDTRAGSRST
ncbi:MAG: IclR family transcriptional regulator [Actinomycetota bacterium]|nr:IclR family transcriptional regulator [Actinomycetota bacterium]